MADSSHLVVLHYHLRAGGVRRVIEIALPAIARAMRLRTVTLATGEPAPVFWLDGLGRAMRGVEVRQVVEPAFRYASERKTPPRHLREQLEKTVGRTLADADAVWFHNPSLARNVPLVEAVNAELLRRRIPAIYHHHDLWVDNRWSRWPELRALGYRTLDDVARVVFPGHVFHATINRLDLDMIRKNSAHRVGWMPNPASCGNRPAAAAVRHARAWLREQLGGGGPVWISPTRFLRRKNLAEAVLLARWLRPEAWLVTTAAVSSREEALYARKLRSAARRGAWRARFGILVDGPDDAPEVSALIAASEAVMLTSVQEGFGLPCIEAVAAGRPLIARSLPNVMPDLRRIGFRLPHLYDEVWIDRGMFDISAERKRQSAGWTMWKRTLPASVRPLAGHPAILDDVSGPVAFSRLTLDAQLEVLALPPDQTWTQCARWNPVLAGIRSKPGALEIVPWPEGADETLDVESYAAAFCDAMTGFARAPAGGAEAIQRAFIEQRLGSDFVFPILIE